MMCCCPVLLFVGAVAWAWPVAVAFPLASRHVVAQRAFQEWLLADNRLKPIAVDISCLTNKDQEEKFVVSTTRKVMRGEVLFRLASRGAVWTAADAYQDRDLGPKLRDYAAKAGPGFGVVALSGVLAAEKIRRYRRTEGQGTAPESTGFSVPSKHGAFARLLWALYEEKEKSKGSTKNKNIIDDESLMDTVRKGVNLLVPLLDVAARRAWSAAVADNDSKTSSPGFLSREWARKAMFNDGSALSWSRGDLKSLAMRSFALVLEQQRPPPPYLLSGVGSLIPEPFLDVQNSPDSWPGGEALGLVPLVEDLLCLPNEVISEATANAALGSPPPKSLIGDGGDCLWCVAARDFEAGQRIVASDPWD